jgi:cobaltochelatase CobT
MAAKAAVLLGETLDRLQVPFEVIGFTTAGFEAREAMRLGLTPAYEHRTTRCSPLEHRLYKSFPESYRQVRTRLAGIQPRHNNWDEEHLLFAYRRIQARPEHSRLILVVGDGQPNGDADHLIRTVAAVEKLGCRVVGIGIGEEFVRRIYRHAVVVADFRQLAEALLEILAGEIRRGVSTARRAAVLEAQPTW